MIGILRKINRKYNLRQRISSMISYSFCLPFGLISASKWSCNIAGRISSLTYTLRDDKEYKFIVNNPLLFWRAKTLFTKETETIDWLRNIPSGEILYDVGANVGIYSLYAGLRGVKVFSFEPESSNYSVLNKNIQLNNTDNVIGYCIALSDKELFDFIGLSSVETGSAHHSFGEIKDFRGNDFIPVFKQGCFSTTIDQLILKYKFPVPDHIKIDVDGLESKIIKGMKETLKKRKLKSILVELNEGLKKDLEIIKTFEMNGFKITATGKEDKDSETGMIVKNYIFSR